MRWPWPLKLIYSHCLLRFNISSENNDFGFNSIQKINFSKISHLNGIWSKFDLDLKYIWTNLEGPTPSMLHVLEKKIFSYHKWAWRSSWSCEQNILHTLWLTYHKESSHEICVKLGQWFLKNYNLIFWWDPNMSNLSWKVKGQPLTFGTYL